MIVSRWAYDVRCRWVKSGLMYKILNEQSAPSLREKFIKIKDLNREYNLRSNGTDPKPKTNCLKRSFKYSGTVFLPRRKRHLCFTKVNAVCPLYRVVPKLLSICTLVVEVINNENDLNKCKKYWKQNVLK